MDFSWTEEQEIWRRTVRDFAQKKIKPKVRDIDTNKKIPETIIKDMAKLGLLAPTVSKKYGGSEVDWTMACIAAEAALEMGIRGVRSYSIGAEGTMNIMRIIIARELLGKEFLPYR